MVTWYGGILFLLLLPCTSELHIVLSGNNGVHAVIKCVCTFPWLILVLFTHLFSSFSLNTRCYFPSPLMPSILVHYLSLPSKTFPALEKSGMVWVWKQSLQHAGCKYSVKVQGRLRTGKQESFKSREHFYFTRKNRDAGIKRESLTKQNTKWGTETACATAVHLFFQIKCRMAVEENGTNHRE